MPEYKRNRYAVGAEAFTVVEIILFVIMVGAFLAMVLPRLAGNPEQARLAAAKSDVTVILATALKLYELDSGNLPLTSEGLAALVSKPAGAGNWKGPYLEKKPLDPWGRDYKYVSPGVHRPQDYDLSSLGRDGAESADDITNWKR